MLIRWPRCEMGVEIDFSSSLIEILSTQAVSWRSSLFCLFLLVSNTSDGLDCLSFVLIFAHIELRHWYTNTHIPLSMIIETNTTFSDDFVLRMFTNKLTDMNGAKFSNHIFHFCLFLFYSYGRVIIKWTELGVHSQHMDGEDCSSSSFSSTSRASLDQPDGIRNSSRSPSTTSGSGENLIVLCHGDSSSSDSPSSYQNAEWFLVK